MCALRRLPIPCYAQALLEDVSGADAQHGGVAAQHADVLDQLLRLHGQRMAALRAQFEADLAAVTQEFERWGGRGRGSAGAGESGRQLERRSTQGRVWTAL